MWRDLTTGNGCLKWRISRLLAPIRCSTKRRCRQDENSTVPCRNIKTSEDLADPLWFFCSRRNCRPRVRRSFGKAMPQQARESGRPRRGGKPFHPSSLQSGGNLRVLTTRARADIYKPDASVDRKETTIAFLDLYPELDRLVDQIRIRRHSRNEDRPKDTVAGSACRRCPLGFTATSLETRRKRVRPSCRTDRRLTKPGRTVFCPPRARSFRDVPKYGTPPPPDGSQPD